MRLGEIVPLRSARGMGIQDHDWLTDILIWMTFFLIAALVAVGVDLWLWPPSEASVAQIAALASPSSVPTDTPALEVTSASTSAAPSPPIPPTAVVGSPTPATPPPCVPPDDWGIHIVQEGNTLFSLARRYGVDVETLMYVNCLNTYTIFIGQRLYVPGALVTPSPFPTSPGSAPSAPPATPRPGASVTPLAGKAGVATPPPSPTPPSPFRVNIPNRYLNIILLGSDRRPGSGAWRTDSMIIVSVDLQDPTVRLLSIPRDLWVYIPGHGYNRINTADLWGELAKRGSGPDRIKQTIYQNLGIPIHYYVRVDFQGFIKIIDTVGGVTIDVDCPLPDINLSAGIHHMDGKHALRYARSRKSTNDFDRGRRQRKVLLALWDQALNLNIIPKLPELWRTMSNSFQTDLPLDQVINLAYVGAQLRPQRIISRAIGPAQVQSWITPEGAAVLLPREAEIRKLLESLYAPVPSGQLDAPEKVRLWVLNGSSRREAEQLAAAALKWDGFRVVGTGVADRRDYPLTSVLIFRGDQATGERVARSLRVPLTAVQMAPPDQPQPDPANPVDILVILGRNYDPCQR